MNLAHIQLLSLTTKGITIVLGSIQAIVIARLLSESEYGLVGLVISVGAAIGVSQHLGIVDGAIREIAILKNQREIGKVIWVSLLARQAVTIPLSLLLLVFAGVLARDFYHKPELIPFIQLYAGALILQGFQDVFGAALTGMKNFYELYFVQIITAVLNIAAFGLALWLYGTAGYFYAVIAMTTIMAGSFLWIITYKLGGDLNMPSLADVKFITRRLIKTSSYMYASRIFFVIWHRLPLLVLGGVLAFDQLGFITIAVAVAGRLTVVAAALSEVNLSWMSSLFTSERERFERIVTTNMQRVSILIALMTLAILVFTPEILLLAGTNYAPAKILIYIMTVAFFFYSLLDIGTSSVFVAANQPRTRMLIFLAMTAVPAVIIGWLYVTNPSALLACLAVLAGSIVSYIIMTVVASRRYHIPLVSRVLLKTMGLMVVVTAWLLTDPILPLRIIIFLAVVAYVWREAKRHHILPNLLAIDRPAAAKRRLNRAIICFAGAAYDQPSWTNRQHMMSRVSAHHPVLYVEPRIWIIRYLLRNWRNPTAIIKFITRIVAFEQKSDQLFIKSQWNLLPMSREYKLIARINHALNRFSVAYVARRLGFVSNKTLLWLYDTEAAEYLPDFPGAFVLYDCVDDHAAQAGVDRNPARVVEEETAIIARANVVTVTSKKLYELKHQQHPNTHLVLNAGDVTGFVQTMGQSTPPEIQDKMLRIDHPIVGCVGALDSYKLDFDMLLAAAKRKPAWQFVFIGEPVVDGDRLARRTLSQLPNVHLLGAVDHSQVPWYVSYFDVCLIPYRSNRYNEASFPLKFWEFMVTGKPIVVTGLPELAEYANVIGFAHSFDQFVAAIETALTQPSMRQAERVALAHNHTWQKRVEQILELLPQ